MSSQTTTDLAREMKLGDRQNKQQLTGTIKRIVHVSIQVV